MSVEWVDYVDGDWGLMGLKGSVLSQISHVIMTHGNGCILKYGSDISMKRSAMRPGHYKWISLRK